MRRGKWISAGHGLRLPPSSSEGCGLWAFPMSFCRAAGGTASPRRTSLDWPRREPERCEMLLHRAAIGRGCVIDYRTANLESRARNASRGSWTCLFDAPRVSSQRQRQHRVRRRSEDWCGAGTQQLLSREADRRRQQGGQQRDCKTAAKASRDSSVVGLCINDVPVCHVTGTS